MQECLFERKVEIYLQGIYPVRDERRRWRQYNACKAQLLQLIPPEMHDIAIRMLTNKLHL